MNGNARWKDVYDRRAAAARSSRKEKGIGEKGMWNRRLGRQREARQN
jgi:hypothetical protein